MVRKSSDHASPLLHSRTALPTSPNSLPEVFLNHFYLVLDSATYQAIEKDVFLRRHFAVNEKRTTTNAEMTYTGLYFYGMNTYFEFFDITDFPQRRVGDTGIAFGVDQSGTISVLQEKLGPTLEPSLKSVTRLFQGRQIPWFFMATTKSLPYESELSCWVMEYHPEFLANWNSQPKGTNRGISRKEILDRYCEVLEPVEEACLEDVVGLTVAADGAATESLTHLCLQLGYQIGRQQSGDVALRGPTFALRLTPATESVRGIREVTMHTRSLAPRAAEHPLGRSVLKFVDSSAIWVFR
jgi:hypothetical protein